MFEYRSDLSLDVLSGYRGSLTTVFNVLEMFDNTFCASGKYIYYYKVTLIRPIVKKTRSLLRTPLVDLKLIIVCICSRY